MSDREQAGLTKSQRWALERASEGHRVFAGAGYEVHTSFATGEVSYKGPSAAIKVCERNGWIIDGFITDLGRAALANGDGK